MSIIQWRLWTTTAQIRTAIEVLKKLGEHINTNAANEVIGLHETQHSDQQAARIGSRTIEPDGGSQGWLESSARVRAAVGALVQKGVDTGRK